MIFIGINHNTSFTTNLTYELITTERKNQRQKSSKHFGKNLFIFFFGAENLLYHWWIIVTYSTLNRKNTNNFFRSFNNQKQCAKYGRRTKDEPNFVDKHTQIALFSFSINFICIFYHMSNLHRSLSSSLLTIQSYCVLYAMHIAALFIFIAKISFQDRTQKMHIN